MLLQVLYLLHMYQLLSECLSDIRKKCVTKQLKKDACLDDEKSRATYGAAMTNANIEHDLHDSAFEA